MQAEELLEQVACWAAAQPDIAAVLLVGSHARGTPRADSDIDLVLLTDEPQRYFAGMGWTAQFGSVAAMAVEDYGALTALRVRYAAGLEVEFGFARPAWATLPLDPGTAQVVAGGVRLIWDPCGLGANLASAPD